jgi:glutamate/tyrosine decarboxylase-like PLP-dependent enzyme
MKTDGTREAALNLNAETFRMLGHRLVDQLAERLAAMPRRPITRADSPSAVRAALDLNGPLPESGMDAASLLDQTTRLLFDHSLFNGHPRFFGYITSSPAPIGMLGDFLAAALNPNVGSFGLAPAATEVESQTVRWIVELIGYPAGCGGLLVSGGNMANLVCFLAARHAKPGLVYASEETHTWIQKAADISGIGAELMRWIPTDASLRMDVAALRRQLDADKAAGGVASLIIGTAGTVSTGVVDPLPEMAAICKEYGAWFHVDGAYGGFAAAVPEAPDDLRALSEADSVAVDPHKWLYAPLEAGCALVRDRELLRAAFSHHPPYYHFDEQATNFVDYGLQNSRGFRALKVWLALRQVGASGYRKMISDDIRLSRAMADAVDRHPELELMTQELSITTFRYVSEDLKRSAGSEEGERQLNAINRELLDRLQRGGEVFVSNAVIRGRYALRACIVNFHTQLADVEALPAIVARVGREVGLVKVAD